MVDRLYPITVPKWGIEMQEGTITGWQVELGATVAKGDELIDIETDKIVNSMEAPVDGVVCRRLVEEGETLKVGELLGVIATGDAAEEEIDAFIRDFVPADASFGIDEDAAPGSESGPAAASAPPSPVEPAGSVRASPVAKRLAKQLGIDLSTITGTGRNGRISKEDVEAAAASRDSGASTQAAAISPMSSRRQTIARRLVASKQEIPHYYLTRTIDIESALAAKGPEASLNALIVAAVARALAQHPGVNVHVRESGIEQRATIDVNVAVDTAEGLSAPLIRGADAMSLAELTAAIADVGERARGNTLTAADLEPGGFTVSSLGALGIESFTAIINPPQAAILAIGAVYREPVMSDGKLAASARIRVTMSCDHRVIDGADGARFLQTLADELGE
ncbi:MAG: dihydrolipoamide acetyltransferase family protein [Woeseiaceae bacterium]|nr:dihydrolipoamide acetyltransferase family protein [Woeseiaceae bacterium]